MTGDKTGWDAMIKRAELRETLADTICASDIRDAEGRILYYRQADAVLGALSAAGLLAEDEPAVVGCSAYPAPGAYPAPPTLEELRARFGLSPGYRESWRP